MRTCNDILIKPAKCCYNCKFYYKSIDSSIGNCIRIPDSMFNTYSFEYCKFFKSIYNKK